MGKKKKAVKENSSNSKQFYEDKKFHWILGVIAGLVVLFLLASATFRSINSFEYEGLTFTKEKFGNIPLYKYQLLTNQIDKITGNVIGITEVNLNLRIDPRKNTVPIEGEIYFAPREKFVYVSVNATDLARCEYSSVGIATLSVFLSQSGFTLKGASPDATQAEEARVRHTTCDSRPDNTVILIQASEETKVTNEENCHTIDISNCEVLEATEKYIVQAIIDAKTRGP